MSERRRNLEIKARVRAPEQTLAAALEFGARDEGDLVQRDTYFHAVKGRLKLREAPPAMAELISYARADREGPKVSHYRVLPVADPVGLTEALDDALGIRVVVEKTRRLLLWQNVRIHVDRVTDLGSFIELEAVAASPGGLEAERDKVERLRAALGIEDAHLISRGYADQLEGRN